ncbi:MAG: 1-acyl-sn-glycerol-3-phosphate acyltransferase [Acidobacteria bacterium]|nr:1-acyl-sn-glycerol-3-phosphate acyltransferase [Acidobacteriota bacterium]
MSFLWSLLVKDPLIILATILMAVLSVASSFFDPDGRKQHAISRAWAKLLLWLAGAKVRVRGMEHIDPARNYVFVGNHLSLFDTPLVLANIPQQFLFLVAARYVKIPFLGTHLRRHGHFSVDASDVRGSLKVMTEAARCIREEGLSILMFPEGSRARGEMGEFKEGAAYIAIKSGVPVVPFAIRGTREMLPVGSVHVRGVPLDFVIGEPVPTADLSLKDREQLTALMREKIASLLGSLR